MELFGKVVFAEFIEFYIGVSTNNSCFVGKAGACNIAVFGISFVIDACGECFGFGIGKTG